MSYDPTQPAPQAPLPLQVDSPEHLLPGDSSFRSEPLYSALSPDASTGSGFSAYVLWQRLGRTGKTTLLVGVLTLMLFALPWYASPDPNGTITFTGLGSKNITYIISNRVTQSGFGIAIGAEDAVFNKVVNEGGQNGTFHVTYKADSSNPSIITLYLYLWLVPLSALALIAAAWFLSQRRISSRLAIITLIASSALSLIMEVSFLVAVNSAESNTEHVYNSENIHLTSPLMAVAWGFWLAWIVAVLGLGAGIYLFRQERKDG